MYRCLSCSGLPHLCLKCCLETHQRNPFHKIQEWKDGFFQTTHLRNLGFKLLLGHNGNPCPQYSGDDPQPFDFRFYTDEEILLVDVTGVQIHEVGWCNCSNHLTKPYQLLQSGLFPATMKSPQTAFSFQLLDGFYLDVMECHTSAMSVYAKLRHLTDNVNPESVPVIYFFITSIEDQEANFFILFKKDRYRELMTASRQWNDIHARKWAGFGHDEDSVPGEGDLAIFCTSCPQPGVNLQEGWEDDPLK